LAARRERRGGVARPRRRGRLRRKGRRGKRASINPRGNNFCPHRKINKKREIGESLGAFVGVDQEKLFLK